MSAVSAIGPRGRVALLWAGQLLSGIGDRLHVVALMWIAVEAVGERAGFVAAAGPAAQLMLGLLGGVYADRWNKRHAMLAADVLRAAAVATLAVAGSQGVLSLWHLAAVGGAIGALDSLFQPALRASLPLLAPEPDSLLRANAWFEITHRLAAVIGPPMVGALLAFLPIEQLFAIDAATFAASALAILWLGRGYAWKARPDPTAAADRERSSLREIRGALSLVAANPPVAWSIGLAVVWNIGTASAMTLGLPLLARDVLGGGPALYGYLVGAYGVGNVLSNLFMAWRPIGRRVAVMFSGGLIWGVGMLMVAFSPTATLALLCCALAAVGGPLTDVIRAYLIQTEFPPDQVGKVYSLRVTASKASHGIGLILAAPLFAFVEVTSAIAIAGGAVALAFAVALFRVRETPTTPQSGRGSARASS